MTSFRSRDTCRSCGERRLDPIIDLGDLPLANALLSKESLGQPEPLFPLRLVHCRGCTLVQIREEVPPETLFRHYFYLSSFSDTTVASARAIAERMVSRRALGPGSLVVEVASNDGYLLQHYLERGVRVLGIEPAQNIAEVARSKGIETIAEFFTRDLAGTLAKRADVLHANNVLAHVPDLDGFVAGVASTLKEEGVAVVEVPYLWDMIGRLEFDTIYHEHLCYFSISALDVLFSRHGIPIGDVEWLSIHGGSLRVFAGRDLPRNEAVDVLLDSERARGGELEAFGGRVARLRGDLRSVLLGLKSEGKRIAAYGASAKGTTLLGYAGIGADVLDFVADRSTVKRGLYTPGSHLLVEPSESILERMPDYVLLLAWNFADEILAQQQEYRRRGGKFILPLPNVEIV